MGASVNVKQVNEAGTGAKDWIILNRQSKPDYSLNIIITGTVTASIQATLKQQNNPTNEPQAGAAQAEDIFDISGLTGITASQASKIVDTPLEAIRVNQTAGTGSVTLHVMQAGEI